MSSTASTSAAVAATPIVSPVAKLISADVDAAEIPSKPKIEYPLTSFASTPHNVACIAFLLGGLWSIGLLSASQLIYNRDYLNWSTSAVAFKEFASTFGGRERSLYNAVTSPVLGVYLSCWAMFHLFEFIVTSIWNPDKLSVSCELILTSLVAVNCGLIWTE